MFSAIVYLLLLLVSVNSYIQTVNQHELRSASSIAGPYRRRQVAYGRKPQSTVLFDSENSSPESTSLFEKLQRPKALQSSNDRVDAYKAERLLSKDWEIPNAIEDIRCYLAVNESFVPVIGVHKKTTFIKLRSFLFGKGVYPGVEYKILNITILSNSSSNCERREVSTLQGLLNRGRGGDVVNDGSSGWIARLFSGQTQLIQTSGGDSSVIIDIQENPSDSLDSYQPEEDLIELTVKPAYPLIRTLEKKWPVKVRLSAVPYVFSRGMYTTVTLLGTLGFALSYFLGALLLTKVFTLSFVNSRSMTPTILPGDLILVEKISPVIRRSLFHVPPASEGDVVFFSTPPLLLQYIEESNTPTKTQDQPLSKSSEGKSGKSNSNRVNIRDEGAGKEKNNFNKEFLAAQKSISPTQDARDGIEVLVPAAASPKAQDRNPFHYRNLRPIGSNTLLVKRLQTISYPEFRDSRASITAPIGGAGTGAGVGVGVGVGKGDGVSQMRSSDVVKSSKTLQVRGIKEEKKGPVCLLVRGDNPDVSLDSRQWGCLDEDLVIGRPILRVLPLKRFGFLR